MKLKIVPSLHDLCLIGVARMTLNACKRIEQKCGNYSKKKTVNQLELLQSYLVNNVGATFNSVYEKACTLLVPLKDTRILFALKMQNYIRYFIYQTEAAFYDLQFDLVFWEYQFGKLVNVRILDIRDIYCTDFGMETICDTCSQLEIIKFMSNPLGEGGVVHPVLPRDVSITSASLSKLTLLKHLRIVEDVSNFECVSTDFLKPFFHRLLPKLENFHHPNLEELVFDNLGQLKSLPLTCLKIYDAKQHKLLPMLRLCPKLIHLELCESMYGGIFDDLTNRPVEITNLGIYNFQADFLPGLVHFLLNKGEFLGKFTLDTDAVISVNDVQVIGECCPNLQALNLTVRISRSSNFPFKPFETERPLFPRLNTVALKGFTSAGPSTQDPRIVDLFLDLNREIISLTLQGSWITLFKEAIEARKTQQPDKIILPHLRKLEFIAYFSRPDGVWLLQYLTQDCRQLVSLHLPREFYWFRICDNVPLRKKIKIILSSKKNVPTP